MSVNAFRSQRISLWSFYPDKPKKIHRGAKEGRKNRSALATNYTKNTKEGRKNRSAFATNYTKNTKEEQKTTI